MSRSTDCLAEEITASGEGGRDFSVPGATNRCYATQPNLMKYTLLINTTITIFMLGVSGAVVAADSKTSPAESDKTKAETTKASGKGQSLSAADKAFIKEAAKGGMMEVAMGQVAEKNASDAQVKKFGARMVADHGKANSELKSIAAEEGVDLPAEKNPGKWKSDKEYMGMMVKDHEKDLADFEKEAKNGSDADVKRFADKTSAVIRKHLQMAKDIDAKLK